MTENKNSTSTPSEPVPFGAMERPKRKRTRKPRPKADAAEPKPSKGERSSNSERGGEGTGTSTGGENRRREASREGGEGGAEEGGQRPPRRRRGRRRKPGGARRGEGEAENQTADPSNTKTKSAEAGSSTESERGEDPSSTGTRRRSRRGRRSPRGNRNGEARQSEQTGGQKKQRQQGGGGRKAEPIETEGLLLVEHAGHGHLRRRDQKWLASKQDVHVAPRITQKFGLREGSMIKGIAGPGFGRHKHELIDVTEVDGRPPKEARQIKHFKSLTTIDPDYHYAVGTETGDLSLRVLDLMCPVGRGQRGLIVAPPRSGKTILMQKFAKAIEDHYPDVHPMVLLVDERPEEATEWTRTMSRGEVFVSTNDEPLKHHVQVCETVWKRCQRLVELGEDVVLILDSITRMARAYNNVYGNSGKTMSGGLDSRAMERPKQFFGSARNTETAGSLTILGTTLIETGSRMDQVIFEEFKGTGNMELVLSRKLADRRVFPAIDIERSGTRKEEKLVPRERLRLTNTLRRVLSKMHFAEAMELLLSRLENCETNDEFLARFQIDPD